MGEGSLFSKFATMPLITCTKCNKVIDSSNFAQIAQHNKDCGIYSRLHTIQNLIQVQDDHEKVLQNLLLNNKRSGEKIRVSQPDVRPESIRNRGAYTSSILSGIPSEIISVSASSDKMNKCRVGLSKGGESYLPLVKKRKTSSMDIDNNDHPEKGIVLTEHINKEGSRVLIGNTADNQYDIEITMNDPSHQMVSDLLEFNEDNDLNENIHDSTNINNDNAIDLEIEHQSYDDDNVSNLDPRIFSTSSLIDTENLNDIDKSFGIQHSSVEVALISLVSILASVNAPYHVYDKILKWAKNIDLSVLKVKSISYRTLVYQTAEKYGLGSIFPSTKLLLLPSHNAVKVTTFSFLDQLYSLLSDPELMKPANLIYGDDIYKKAGEHGNNHCYNDIDTGDWFLRTQRSMCTDPGDVLCPIILYIDKTHINSNAAEPISFCLGIFVRQIRMMASSWRNLGMIPGKLGDLVPNKKFALRTQAEMRLNDWHFVCEHILSDVKKIQKLNGLEWHLFGKKCCLKLPIMFIIGDIEGHDKVCSRKSGHGKRMTGVTHSCKIKRKDCGNPDIECELLCANEICSKQNSYQDPTATNEEKECAKRELDHLGFYSSVKNAFAQLDFGSSSYGIHGACAICGLHTFKQKFPKEVMDVYLSTFGKGVNVRGTVQINKCIPKLIQQIWRQSDRNYPVMTSFTKSFLNAKFQLSANEKYARIFALSLFCMTSYGWEYTCGNHNQEEKCVIKERILLMEKSLTIYKFLFQEKFHISNKFSGNESVMEFMSLFKKVLEWKHKVVEEFDSDIEDSFNEEIENLSEEDSDDGSAEIQDHLNVIDETNECQFPKFHYLKHIIPQIVRFGSAMNFDGGFCESNHKYLTKTTGQRTQGRSDTFDEQTSFNLSAKIIMDRAFRQLNMSTKKGVSNTFITSDSKGKVSNESIMIHSHSSRFHIQKEQTNFSIKWKNGCVKPQHEYPAICIEELTRKILVPNFDVNKFQGFTCLKWNDEIIRAHPSYRSKSSWYDYVNVKWHGDNGTYYICPSHVFMFFEIRDHPDINVIDGIWAVVHSSAAHNNNQSKPTRDAIKIWKERNCSKIFQYWEMESKCECIPVSSIDSTTFAYPDFCDEDMVQSSKFIIQVKPVSSWHKEHETLLGRQI